MTTKTMKERENREKAGVAVSVFLRDKKRDKKHNVEARSKCARCTAGTHRAHRHRHAHMHIVAKHSALCTLQGTLATWCIENSYKQREAIWDKGNFNAEAEADMEAETETETVLKDSCTSRGFI